MSPIFAPIEEIPASAVVNEAKSVSPIASKPVAASLPANAPNPMTCVMMSDGKPFVCNAFRLLSKAVYCAKSLSACAFAPMSSPNSKPNAEAVLDASDARSEANLLTLLCALAWFSNAFVSRSSAVSKTAERLARFSAISMSKASPSIALMNVERSAGICVKPDLNAVSNKSLNAFAISSGSPNIALTNVSPIAAPPIPIAEETKLLKILSASLTAASCARCAALAAEIAALLASSTCCL